MSHEHPPRPAAPPKRSWDYAALAADYEKRAPYHPALYVELMRLGGFAAPARAADIGAGTGRCASLLAAAGWHVDAVEPCAEMRAIGERLTRRRPVRWIDAHGEATTLPAAGYQLVCFASSLNVMERGRALREARRLLVDGGRLLCVYNHRSIEDGLQSEIQALVARHLGGYEAGERRGDSGPLLLADGAFGELQSAVLRFSHRYRADEFVAGFRAHATLVRQAGPKLERILADIRRLLGAARYVDVPFDTRLWMARAT